MADQIKKILFTSDLSDESIKVFEQTVGLAYQIGASIILLHVIDSTTSDNQKRVSNYFIDAKTYERIRQEGQEAAQKVLIGKQKNLPIIQHAMEEHYVKSAQKVCEPDSPVTIESIQVKYGNPAEKILEVSEEEGCDLIAMGYHKKGSIFKALAGRAEKGVMKKSKKNLFMIPLEEE